MLRAREKMQRELEEKAVEHQEKMEEVGKERERERERKKERERERRRKQMN